jgi:NADP-dependent 3-hydroxy acid dehydrogenase YdfG
VDVLVNNAGVFKAFGKVSEVDPEQWWYEIEVNLKGQFLCAQAVLPGMIQRRRGRIINLASVGGTGTFPAISAYSTSKAALIHLTASITRMLDELSASDELLQRAEYLHTAFNEVMSTKATIAPERVVSLVCALAAGRADRLSGRYISIDDELDDLVARAEEIRTEDLYTLRIRS